MAATGLVPANEVTMLTKAHFAADGLTPTHRR